MRMNYKSYPTDYIQQLKRERGVAGRKKSRAFMEYWDDMEHGDHNSESFYAKSWDVSRSTSHEWIKEFRDEVDLFINHMHLKNSRHYSHAVFSTEQNEQSQPSKTSTLEQRNTGTFTESTEQNEQSQPREVFNLYDDGDRVRELKREWWNDPVFNDLFFIYSQNTKFVGKKEDAFEQYKKVNIDGSILILAAVRYLHDQGTNGKRYNLANFLKNDVYLSYIPKMINVSYNGTEIVGEYNQDTHQLIDANGKAYMLKPERLVELFKSGELKFIKPVGRAA